VTREVQSVLLVLVGGALLRISLTDAYLRYVKEGLQPFLVASGVLILLLGLASVWFDGLLRATPRAEPDAAGAAGAATAADAAGDVAVATHDGPSAVDEHGHAHGGPAIAWLLALPVVAIFVVAPPALGSYAAGRESGSVAAPQDSSFPPLPDADVVVMPVSDYAVRAVWDAGTSLDGRTVRLTGFVTPRPGGGWFLSRMALSCCAADARAIKVEVRDAAAPPADTWVELTGRWRPSAEPRSDDGVPVIAAQEVRQVEAPRETYE
jgi:uncharacterized repeat protein (TIGR03943 family)